MAVLEAPVLDALGPSGGYLHTQTPGGGERTLGEGMKSLAGG